VRIASIDTTIVDIPCTRPHRFAGTEMTVQTYLLVRVETADGAVGVGEGVSPGGPWWSGEGIETQQAMIEHHLAPHLRAMADVRLATLVPELDRVAHGNDFAKAAVEMAVFDAVGRSLDLPVSALLAGGPARSTIPVRWALGAADAETVLTEAKQRMAEGFGALKLKMGALPIDEDLERVDAVVGALGPDVDVLVDPNGAWDLRTAGWALAELERIGVAVVEQPVPRDALHWLARLADRPGRLTVMADESVCRPADALAAVAAGACDAVAVKVGKAGGLLRAYAVGAIASAAGLRCYGGTALESSVGAAAAAHVFSVLPELSMGCELVGPLLLTEDVVADPVAYDAGSIVVPTGPGLGVEVDWGRVRAHAREPGSGRLRITSK
jgi:muconate/chloromuconate cycloisomerase